MKALSRAFFFSFLFLIGIIGMFFIDIVLAGEKIDINTAPQEELEKIIGVGPAIAQRIINERPFFSIQELIKVKGIGEITLEKIIEQGLASASGQLEHLQSQEIKPLPTKLQQTQPQITLSYPQDNPVNKEIEVSLSLANFKNTAHDVKISIEKESVLSFIYNEAEDKWQSSNYYINNLFSGSFFEGKFNLKIREEAINFKGEADILVRVRESGKSNYQEHKEKINIIPPKEENFSAITSKDSRGNNQEIFKIFYFSHIFLVAFLLAVSSGTIIFYLKKRR